MHLLRFLGLLAVALLIAGCGDSATPTASAPTGANGANARSDTGERAHTESAKSPDPADLIHDAEKAAKSELPKIPLWKGARFQGIVKSSSEICVNRIVTKRSASALGGIRASHVIVTIPDLEVGEPLDGTCRKPKADPNDRISSAALARIARHLVSLIDGDQTTLRREANHVRHKLDFPDPITTVQANLIHSATAAIIDGLDSGDARQLDAARRYLNESLDQ